MWVWFRFGPDTQLKNDDLSFAIVKLVDLLIFLISYGRCRFTFCSHASNMCLLCSCLVKQFSATESSWSRASIVTGIFRFNRFKLRNPSVVVGVLAGLVVVARV